MSSLQGLVWADLSPVSTKLIRRESVLFFFAHPLRGLNEILDPSKATSARPRKLGLPDFVGTGRPQTCAFAQPAFALCTHKRWPQAAGRFLRPRRVPQNFVGPLRGRAGLGVKIRIEVACMVPMRKFSQATEPVASGYECTARIQAIRG